ncbi:MAG: c-type cytochrome [Acidobacteriaceae bacterium]|nr:c-type cytochrome [Acidobacteriaceae bacterium]MBV8570143.1 c-type cytochrome [Acidobacteriaceae bacterium]
MKFRVCAAALICSAFLTAQQQEQNPPQNPPPQPPAGAANGPQPGPAVKSPGPGERTGDQPKAAGAASATMQEAMRNFLAIGAPPDPEAVKRGQALFVSTCGFCHGTNANGGATGPDLVRSVLVLHDQGTGKEIGPVIHNGRPAKGMPAFSNLTDVQIKDIAAFLLGRTQSAANRMDYKILNIVTGDPKAGEAYFTAHCASCHSPSGDLAHIATKYEPVALQARFLYPKTQHFPGTPGPPPDPREQKTVIVTLSSGQSYSGKLERLDDFSVALTDSSGEYRSWLFDDEQGIKVDVHDPLKKHADMIPQYTDTDMHNVLAYLETLK